MANVITNIFKVPELRKRVLFTLSVLIVYRIGVHIPVPGINVDALKEFFANAAATQGSGLLNFFDLFVGGALKKFSIFTLGIMPYISASIILDLLKVVVPHLEQLSKEGAEGQKKISQYTRYGTVILCAVQSFGITRWLMSQPPTKHGTIVSDPGVSFVFVAIIAIVTGTLVLVWFGDIITERGVGNGISLIIMAGIVVRIPQAMSSTIKKIGSTGEPIIGIILVGIFFMVVAASILLTQGERRIPLQQGKKAVTNNAGMAGGRYLPIKINAAGVIPIIFAQALMMFPSQIMQFLTGGGSKSDILNTIMFYLTPGQWPYVVLYAGLIIFFCYFYTGLKFNPTEVADNLKKHGSFIPGVRPGQNTADYLSFIFNRITLSGSIFLTVIAIVPDFIIKFWPRQVEPSMAYLFGGTSLLIIVGVTLDTVKQIESQLMMRHYDGFMKKQRMRSR